MKIEYGEYGVPDEVKKLIELENTLKKKGLTLDTIGLVPIQDFFSYWITPPDVIPFAHTGGDGVHFGFLTDFGSITDLNEAPIVCVTPTNDPPIRLTARNINEFMTIASFVPHVGLLDNCWPWKDKESTELIFKDYLTDSWQINRDKLLELLQEVFCTKKVDVAEYVQTVLHEREESIVLKTYDGLGIKGANVDLHRRYSFDPERRQDKEQIVRMKLFLKDATYEEKLGFTRDAMFWYVLTPDYDSEVLTLVIDLLKSLNLKDEVRRLTFRNRI
ncbi:hypothetical protein QTL97_10015 [Sporosarcina thermotolerans]|uniref:Uncharacterized protein n=1 Tax=Sporosarcina thermotolerans TaxID=633404 RepID=A0AAW9AA52_9BACL|nr:hypothetical protein [Sporosarcina thermotolerans]MDW0117270.1 hypothetical protein [Sporosarcina thermotolerans]WHT47431.1 hypothetical protein QNH10_14745 [Sporosarcina thermotolerans]